MYESWIKEALKETVKLRNYAGIQKIYGMLLERLVKEMKYDRDTVVRSLNKTFRKVMSNISFENEPEPSMNHSVVTRIDLGTKKIHQNETQYVVLESRNVNQ